MSEELVNTWKPRPEIILDCPKGSRCVVRRPGPELSLKIAHLQRRLRALRAVSGDETAAKGMTPEEQEEAGLRAIEKMSEEQKELSLEVMRITVECCVKTPRIYANPKPGQTGTDDIPEEDFYFIHSWYQEGCKDPAADESEVTIADADRFPAEQAGGAGVGDSGSNVRGEAEPVGRTKRRRACR